MSDAVLAIENLTVALPAWAERAHAVDGVSLKVLRREILCVVGESGSGKSVMAKAILRLLPEPHVRVTGGRVAYEGQDLLTLAPSGIRAIRGGRIAMIFQEPMVALNPLMTVGRQTDEIIEVHTALRPAQRRQRVIEVFGDVRLPEPERILKSYPHELSGGQRQRVMIAMALALEPALIIADEPTTALDVTTQAQILRLLKELQARHGTAILFITHDFGVVAEIADRVAVMRQGQLVEQGQARDVLERPQHAYTQALVAAVPSLSPRHLLGTRPGARPERPLLAVAGLSKTYTGRGGAFSLTRRRVPAVAGVSLEIGKGSSLALVGESGSGKSTLARCIVGLERADAGAILLEGSDVAQLSRARLRPFRKILQMIFQDPFASLNPRWRVGDIIAQGPIVNGTPRQTAHAEAAELLRLVGLDPKAASRYPHEFSGGQRQRIGIARALAVKPKLIIADEPVSALDVSVQKQVLELLDQLRRAFDLSMLFITHDLRVAAHVCEEIAVMKDGVIVERGATADVFAEPRHEYTKALLAAVPGRDWQLKTLAARKPC
ncbi:MAG TPA: ABC transporter ATP-binding protein [Hyphomicrobiaceae bacterium]|jgi:peptide/nickel transport system ATP-binding protein|nr:ABC transporter ATP-binding protein [Hyphomicrobiaceae bacterium]